MNDRLRLYASFAAMAATALALDLASKSWAFGLVAARGEVVVIPDWFEITAKLNQGGMWSLGAGHGMNANLALGAFSAVASLVMLAVPLYLPPNERAWAVIIGALWGGATGNLYDRVCYGGVRDFIQVYLWGYHYPTFNVADSFLVCGALAILLLTAWPRPADSDPHALNPANGPTT